MAKKIGYQLIKVSATVTRPADTTQYAIGDAITNSTTAPTVFSLDFTELAQLGGGLEIRKVAIVSSVKQSTLPLVNVFLSPTTFTATNDNAELGIADAIVEAGGVWVNCTTQNSCATNAVVEANNLSTPVILASGANKLYGILQAANTYTPVSGEKFTVLVWAAVM